MRPLVGAHSGGAGSVSAGVPRVGCGAAIVRDGRILLFKRLRPPEAGRWSLPGGKVDFLESIEDAVARARTQWTAAKGAGCPVTYWQQSAAGKWEKKA